MTDVHTSEIRSYNMGMIRSKNTKPELLVRKYLHSRGFRFRLNVKKLPGKPDIVLKKYCVVIFIHGCFWHGHKNCKYFVVPKTRTKWWVNKIEGNKKRDHRSSLKLKKLGWNVITLWECELRPKRIEKSLNNLLVKLNEK